MVNLSPSHSHLQFVGNFYQRKMSPSPIAQGKPVFDEKTFLEGGTLVGLFRAIFKSVLECDSHSFYAFINGFDDKNNAENFKNALKECVNDQLIHDEIDQLNADQLTELRNIIAALEKNKSAILKTFEFSTGDDYGYYLYLSRTEMYTSDTFDIVAEDGEVVIRSSQYPDAEPIIVTGAQLLSGCKNLRGIRLRHESSIDLRGGSLQHRHDLSNVNLNGANLKQSCISSENLTNGDLRNAQFDKAFIFDFKLINVRIAGANFKNTTFSGTVTNFTLNLAHPEEYSAIVDAICSIDNRYKKLKIALFEQIIVQKIDQVHPEKYRLIAEAINHIDNNYAKQKIKLMEQLVGNLNALNAKRAKEETPKIIWYNNKLRTDILPIVLKPIYQSNLTISAFVQKALLEMLLAESQSQKNDVDAQSAVKSSKAHNDNWYDASLNVDSDLMEYFNT